MSNVYEFFDENTKSYDNILSVDFSFPSNVKVEDAVKQIDALVSLADNRDDIEFSEHSASIYAKTTLSDESFYT
jgi:cell fate regulator YaaT (PSP1 superfamily)|tara:strand:+ start:3232 stop:3453 length:222 start_codon:yes stop_codon:yes gene_type:complete